MSSANPPTYNFNGINFNPSFYTSSAGSSINSALYVTTTTAQTISGQKTFTTPIIENGGISGSGEITTTNNISTTGTGTITSAGLLTASNGFTVSSGILTLPANSINSTAISGLSTNYVDTSNPQTIGGAKTFTSIETIKKDATGVWATDDNIGQFVIQGSTNTNKRIALMMDTTNNVGILQAALTGTSAYPLCLNPGTVSGDAGKVGIGTISPSTYLDVVTTTAKYGIQHSDGTIKLSTFISSSGTPPAQFGTVTNHGLGFFVNNTSCKLSIDNTGKIGINNNSQTNLLTISKDATGTWATDNDIGQCIITGSTSTDKRLGLMIDTTNNIGIIQAALRLSGAYPLCLNPAGGNVGIGTTSPGYKLDVVTGDGYGIRHSNGTVKLATYIATAGTPPGQFGTESNHSLGFFTNNGSCKLVVHTNGSVGVNTVSPSSSYALDVNGSINCTGTITGSVNSYNSTTPNINNGNNYNFTATAQSEGTYMYSCSNAASRVYYDFGFVTFNNSSNVASSFSVGRSGVTVSFPKTPAANTVNIANSTGAMYSFSFSLMKTGS